jgi:hypothetical protein
MPQRASVFCNFYIRVDREALVSERALNVGSVAFKAMSTKKLFENASSSVFEFFSKIIRFYFIGVFPDFLDTLYLYPIDRLVALAAV